MNLKKLVYHLPFVSALLSYKRSIDNKRLYNKREPYINSIKERLSKDTSIISSNCFTGRIMQDLGMKYNTPTLGLYFMYPDYIEFLQHLEYYLKKARITFVDHSKYSLGDERRSKWKHWYPIGLLDGKVEIHFLHYHTEQEAAEKWYRRASRVNLDNVLIIGMEQNLCNNNDIKAFDILPFKRMLFFSSKNIKGLRNNVYMQEFEHKGEVGDPYKYGHLFYKYLIENLK